MGWGRYLIFLGGLAGRALVTKFISKITLIHSERAYFVLSAPLDSQFLARFAIFPCAKGCGWGIQLRATPAWPRRGAPSAWLGKGVPPPGYAGATGRRTAQTEGTDPGGSSGASPLRRGSHLSRSSFGALFRLREAGLAANGLNRALEGPCGPCARRVRAARARCLRAGQLPVRLTGCRRRRGARRSGRTSPDGPGSCPPGRPGSCRRSSCPSRCPRRRVP